MWIVLQIFLFILNLGLGFYNITINANPYIIALNLFAAGVAALGAVLIALR
jgi:hypothetical protein